MKAGAAPIAVSRANALRVTEHYACFEGEGSSLGAWTYLIRLSGCDLRCWWCDSKFSSFREDEAKELGVAALQRAALKSGAAWASFTGGEPTWRDGRELKALAGLCRSLRQAGLKVKLESNGRRWPAELKGCVDLWSLAPKWDASRPAKGLAGPSAQARHQTPAMRYELEPLKAFSRLAPKGRLQWKFVITFEGLQPRALDLKIAARLLKALPASAKQAPVYFIPEAYAAGDYLQRCQALETAVAAWGPGALKGWDLHVQPQWHRVLHGDARGR